MRAIVTVTGKDKKGIIASVSAMLAEKNINIEDISQTILQDYFAMIMIVDISKSDMELSSLATYIKQKGKEIDMSVMLQHEDIFNAMHKI